MLCITNPQKKVFKIPIKVFSKPYQNHIKNIPIADNFIKNTIILHIEAVSSRKTMQSMLIFQIWDTIIF